MSLSCSNIDFEIPVNIQEESRIFPFRSIELHVPLEVSKGCEASFEVRQGRNASSSVSTGNSLIPSSCDVKHEPAFKPLQGNPGFFPDRASRSPFHLGQQTPGPSHIITAERNLLLRCLWKVGILLHVKPGNHLPSRDDLGYTELFLVLC